MESKEAKSTAKYSIFQGKKKTGGSWGGGVTIYIYIYNVKLAGFSPLTALLHCKLKGPKHSGYIQLLFTVMAATGKNELMFRLNLFSCCERLYTIQVLINHWRYGIVVVLFACGVCILPRPISATVVHTGVCPAVASANYTYSLARLTLYTPSLITLIMKSGFMLFVKQSAACVAVSIQSTRSPPSR